MRKQPEISKPMRKYYSFSVLLCANLALGLAQSQTNERMDAITENKENEMHAIAYFAAGCFWGVEAIFQDMEGVIETTVGYMNGRTQNPSYRDICNTDTGHAEAVEVVYDPSQINYASLCRYFWRLHDPTTINRQGPDVGSQYRSGIFYHTEEEREIAQAVKIEAQRHWKEKIVTEILPAERFYDAEVYHQDYFKNRGITHSGCHFLRPWE